jgi:RimJ/RimL family protein N-acetyltransferase
MKLRELKSNDAPLMLEWMQDEYVVCDLKADFLSKTLDDCLNFIEISKDRSTNINMAIVDENDNYMGTVSLKHINKKMETAEFAITIRKFAMGKGFSKFGMHEILNYGIEKIGLKSIYWCVNKGNERAVKFYDKNGYRRITHVPQEILNHYAISEIDAMYWYVYEKKI